MRIGRSKSAFLCVAVFAFLVIITFSRQGFCDVAGITSIEIDPPAPMEFTQFEITTKVWSGYAMDVGLVGYDSAINGTSIEQNYYFFNSNPGGMSIPLAGGWVIHENYSLSAGSYSVTAMAWINENEFFPMYNLADTRTAYFTVVPEPATIALLCLGGLMLRRRK